MNPVHIGQLLSFEFHHQQKQNSLMRPEVEPGPIMIFQFFIIFNPLGFIHYFVWTSRPFLPVTSQCQARADSMQRNIYLFLLKLLWLLQSELYTWYLVPRLTAISIDGGGECQEVGSNVKLRKRKFSNCPKCLGKVQNKSR